MSTLLVRSIAASFRRAGFAFSSASTTPLDLATLSYDQVRALVVESQLIVSAVLERDGAEPQALTAAELREALLHAEAEMGIDRLSGEFDEVLERYARAYSVTGAMRSLDGARAAASVVAQPAPLPEPEPQPAPAKPAKARK